MVMKTDAIITVKNLRCVLLVLIAYFSICFTLNFRKVDVPWDILTIAFTKACL